MADVARANREEIASLRVAPVPVSSEDVEKWLRAADADGAIADFSLPHCLVSADRLRMRQVFDNVVANSRKYAGTPIEVTAGVDEHFLLIVVRVVARGPGDPVPGHLPGVLGVLGGQRHEAEQGEYVGLVNGDDPGHIVEDLADAVDVAGEEPGRAGPRNAALGGEPGRGGEVVERHQRGEAVLVAGVDHVAVVEELGAGEAALDRLDAGPLDGEAVGVQPSLGRQADVLAVAVVGVAGVAGALLEHRVARTGRVLGGPEVRGEVVALDLMGGRGGSPEEIFAQDGHGSASFVVEGLG